MFLVLFPSFTVSHFAFPYTGFPRGTTIVAAGLSCAPGGSVGGSWKPLCLAWGSPGHSPQRPPRSPHLCQHLDICTMYIASSRISEQLRTGTKVGAACTERRERPITSLTKRAGKIVSTPALILVPQPLHIPTCRLVCHCSFCLRMSGVLKRAGYSLYLEAFFFFNYTSVDLL